VGFCVFESRVSVCSMVDMLYCLCVMENRVSVYIVVNNWCVSLCSVGQSGCFLRG
jgi:hypothetical protein